MSASSEQATQIGAVAKKLGVTTRTIRYYEEIGLMGPPERLGGGARMYNRADVLRLKFILKLKELGITLKEMQELAANFDTQSQEFESITPKLVEILDGHISKVDQKIANLSSLRREIVDYRSRIVDILQGNAPPVR